MRKLSLNFRLTGFRTLLTINNPDDINDIKLGFFSLMMKPLRYYDFDSGEELLQENLTIADKQMIIISGIVESDTIYVVDANNNKDLRDDTIRVLNDFDWFGKNNLIRCSYSVQKQGILSIDSGWIHIGLWDNRVFFFPTQYMLSVFKINHYEYKIGVIDANSSSYCFWRPKMALLSENGQARDTLLLRDYIELGDYIKLGDYYYKFHDFYSGCGTIMLTKEEDYSNKIGVQVGMLAPEFKGKTYTGDTISSADFKGKKVLVANFSGCTRRSYDVYKKILERLGDQIVIIGLESGINENIGGVLIDVEDEFNNAIYKSYRNAYSSYDCYLIGGDGKVSEKFSIFDWEVYLKKFLD